MIFKVSHTTLPTLVGIVINGAGEVLDGEKNKRLEADRRTTRNLFLHTIKKIKEKKNNLKKS